MEPILTIKDLTYNENDFLYYISEKLESEDILAESRAVLIQMILEEINSNPQRFYKILRDLCEQDKFVNDVKVSITDEDDYLDRDTMLLTVECVISKLRTLLLLERYQILTEKL